MKKKTITQRKNKAKGHKINRASTSYPFPRERNFFQQNPMKKMYIID